VIRVLFFARIRDQLDCSGLELEWADCPDNLDALQAYLCARGDAWREALAGDNVIRAINQSVVEGSPPLSDGDEVAFFPPVTGG
jgi:molybdopterin synthase sulfur carrier subunit